MKQSFFTLFLAALTLVFTGCASREARIKRSPEIFARLTPAQQEQVRAGRIDIGFSKDAVRLAVGNPDRIWTRTDAKGLSEVWSYTTWESRSGEPLYTGGNYRYYGGYSPGYASTLSARREHEYFKVVFGPDETVSAIEQKTR